MELLRIENLHASVGKKEILHGVDMSIQAGEIVALMGPNGSGKSTLAHVLMGHPDYTVTQGSVYFLGQDVLALSPEERAKAGLFLSFQYPQTIAGVSMGNFLRVAYNSIHGAKMPVAEFLQLLRAKLELLSMPMDFIQRSVNEGFSGGEKKRAEVLQLSLLDPKLAILDETDSGLDVDALKTVAQAMRTIIVTQPTMAVLVITHYQRMLDYIKPTRVVVMRQGKVVREGNNELATQIESFGYESL